MVTYYSAETAVPVVSGCVAFGTTMCLATLAQKIIGISTANKMVPSLVGMATVCLASIASQRSAICAYDWVNDKRPIQEFIMDPKTRNTLFSPSTASSAESIRISDQIKIPKHDLRVCAIGLTVFKLLGGRFWAIAPSSFTNLGSFSRWSIPCGERYATTSQRALIEKMGRRWGCHTCGSRMLFSRFGKNKFVGDHMPPKSVADQMNKSFLRRMNILPEVSFRFYPQCVNCSNTQGSILSRASHDMSKSTLLPSWRKAVNLEKAGGGRAAHFHGLRFRVNNLTGGILAGVTVVGATKSEVSKGNKKRFEGVTSPVVDLVKSAMT